MNTTKNNIKPKKDAHKKSMEERYPMTVSKELFDEWQKNRRSGDVTKMFNKFAKSAQPISRPIIDRAINYGNIKQDYVAKKITKYFIERVEAENALLQTLQVEGA